MSRLSPSAAAAAAAPKLPEPVVVNALRIAGLGVHGGIVEAPVPPALEEVRRRVELPGEGAVQVQRDAPPDGHVARVVQLSALLRLVQAPVDAAAEEKGPPVVAPVGDGVHAGQIGGQAEGGQRKGALVEAIGGEDPVLAAGEEENPLVGAPFVDGVHLCNGLGEALKVLGDANRLTPDQT